MFFSKKKKRAAKQDQELINEKAAPKRSPSNNVVFEQGFEQSERFKGYKRFHVSYYGYAPAENGLAAFKKTHIDYSVSEIKLRAVSRQPGIFIEVFADGFLLGSIPPWSCKGEQADFIKNQLLCKRVDSAHIRFNRNNYVLKAKGDALIPEERVQIALYLHALE